ncbi:MAG: radical SAM protein [Bacteroidota bacterium]
MAWKKQRLLLRTLTWRKVGNFARLYLSYHVARLRRRPIHWGNPAKVGIEPTTACNLRCPECPSGLRAFTRPTGMLATGAFRQMTDELHRDLVYMLLYFQGEPYLNRNFLDMAAYAAEKGVYVATSTNGHYLSEENARKTVESGLHELTVSIDGATQETYQAYRVGGNLEKVKAGVKRLVDVRKQLKSATPYIILQFLVVGPNEHEIAAIHALGKELGVDKVNLKTAQIYKYEAGSPLIPENERYSRYRKRKDGRYELKNKLSNQCWKLWMGAEITWDGRVLPCCFDKDAQYLMGKVGERPFREIWRNESYRNFRHKVVQSRKEIDICTNCSEGTELWAD